MKLFKWITINGLEQMDYEIWIAINVLQYQNFKKIITTNVLQVQLINFFTDLNKASYGQFHQHFVRKCSFIIFGAKISAQNVHEKC